MTLAGFPAGAWAITAACALSKKAHAATVLAGIRAGGTPSNAFPGACSRRPVACVWRVNRVEAIRPLTVAGAAQAGRQRCMQRAFFLLPVELQPVNQTASTNGADFTVL